MKVQSWKARQTCFGF